MTPLAEVIKDTLASLKASGKKLPPDEYRRMEDAVRNTVILRCRGDFAQFDGGEVAPNKCTMPTMPPSAASCMIAAILGKPCMRWLPWVIVTRPPRYVTMVRLEPKVKFRIDPKTNLPEPPGERMQVAHELLVKPEFFVAVGPYIYLDSPQETSLKFRSMLERRLKLGQFHTPPSLGPRNLFARVEQVDGLPAGAKDFNQRIDSLWGMKRRPGKTEAVKGQRSLWEAGCEPLTFRADVIDGKMWCAPWDVLDGDALSRLLRGVGDWIEVRDGKIETIPFPY